MRLAFCITVKNRSCVIVESEDSLHFVQHVQDKLIACPSETIQPWTTKDGQLVLPLFPKMLQSLLKLKKDTDDWVFVIVDYQSTDISIKEMLEHEIGSKAPWHLETVTDYPYFDRGGGLKKAAELAETKFQTDAVFFCDSDLYFTSRDVLDGAIQSLEKGQFYYPVFFSFVLADHSLGFWRETSFGNFACLLKDYKKTEGWYHNLSWGWEDRALADSIPEPKKERALVSGFFHQWHPLHWEFRVKEYPIKTYLFKDAAVKDLNTHLKAV